MGRTQLDAGKRRSVDCFLTEDERSQYWVWMHSPSVFGTETETVLAFKIARAIHGVPSRVLKALRGQPGVDPELLQRVETFVAGDDSLVFVEDGRQRRIALAGECERSTRRARSAGPEGDRTPVGRQVECRSR